MIITPNLEWLSDQANPATSLENHAPTTKVYVNTMQRVRTMANPASPTTRVFKNALVIMVTREQYLTKAQSQLKPTVLQNIHKRLSFD
jgi:hypothetical protein